MPTLVQRVPKLQVRDADLLISVSGVETAMDVEIRTGDKLDLEIAGNRALAELGMLVVEVASAGFMTKGVTRVWTLAVKLAR